MRAVVLAIVLSACSFEHVQPYVGQDGGGSGSGSGDGGTVTPGMDGPSCAWSYTPTNFDPCMLPAPGALTVSGNQTLDPNTTTHPKQVVTQSDGTMITVIHLSALTVNVFSTLTVTGGTGVVLAVDGHVEIQGTIIAVAGNDNNTHCATSRGVTGADSSDDAGGGGGGGGGGAAENGGNGGNGNGTMAGVGGARGNKVTTTLSPLRGGCAGGNGGKYNDTGTAPSGGRGGGALQISTNTKISVDGMVDAAGRGGGGAPGAQVGAAGGGSGGAIFLEGPAIDLGFASALCADGGSGGEGGGVTVAGNSGVTSPCTTAQGAHTQNTPNSAGGDGGDGGFLLARTGASGQSSNTGGGGGGGGGGAVGWIRLKSPAVSNGGSLITPQSTN